MSPVCQEAVCAIALLWKTVSVTLAGARRDNKLLISWRAHAALDAVWDYVERALHLSGHACT